VEHLQLWSSSEGGSSRRGAPESATSRRQWPISEQLMESYRRVELSAPIRRDRQARVRPGSDLRINEMLRDLDEDGGPGRGDGAVDRELRFDDNLAPLDLDKSPDEKEAGEGCG